MKTLARLVLFIFSWTLFSVDTLAQNEEVPQLRGAIVMGYSHIPRAFEGSKSVAVIPTWGFDIDYVFHPKWAVGLQTDIKVQSFDVEDKNNVVLVRNYPISFAAVGHYRIFEHWSVFAGPGIEYEKNLSLWIFKLGAEYSYAFTERFELGVGLMYENRQDLYDGWTFGVSFNTRLWKPKK